MNNITRIAIGAIAVIGVAFAATNVLSATSQDPAKKPAAEQKKESTEQEKAAAKEAAAKAYAARIVAFKKAFLASKMTLGQAIALAEAETKGKTHTADMDLDKEGKLRIAVGMLVGDKFVEAYVDPETKKVVVPTDEDDEGDEGDEDDEH